MKKTFRKFCAEKKFRKIKQITVRKKKKTYKATKTLFFKKKKDFSNLRIFSEVRKEKKITLLHSARITHCARARMTQDLKVGLKNIYFRMANDLGKTLAPSIFSPTSPTHTVKS